MKCHALSTFLAFAVALVAPVAGRAQTPTATFSQIDDAVAGRCYDPATTSLDPAQPNRLRIGMLGCAVSSPNGSTVAMDTVRFLVEAPDGYYVARVTFTQNGTHDGSRGGAGFRGATWVVGTTARTVPMTAGGWAGTVDLSLERKTAVPVAITTYLAAYGIQVVSGSASASNPAVVVELAPLQ
jgi:hypothetical protein